eukprot:1098348-Prymnesium_polylepis.1
MGMAAPRRKRRVPRTPRRRRRPARCRCTSNARLAATWSSHCRWTGCPPRRRWACSPPSIACGRLPRVLSAGCSCRAARAARRSQTRCSRRSSTTTTTRSLAPSG